jgi:O-antigen ligase
VAARFAGSTMEGANVRFDAWADSLNILRDFWLTGTGFNTYGTAMLRYQTANTNMYFIEAHNDYLQLAVEGGLLVGIPALLLAAALLMEIRRRFREGADDTRTYWLRVGAVAGIAAIALQSLVEFTLQKPGGAVLFATLLAIAIHHPRPRPDRGEHHA